ncbi:MAG: hypothetical protein CMM94_04345 [Rickettsiales bacterium]|nr:hypothetical protein [Rickettsiales bacterium]
MSDEQQQGPGFGTVAATGLGGAIGGSVGFNKMKQSVLAGEIEKLKAGEEAALDLPYGGARVDHAYDRAIRHASGEQIEGGADKQMRKIMKASRKDAEKAGKAYESEVKRIAEQTGKSVGEVEAIHAQVATAAEGAAVTDAEKTIHGLVQEAKDVRAAATPSTEKAAAKYAAREAELGLKNLKGLPAKGKVIGAAVAGAAVLGGAAYMLTKGKKKDIADVADRPVTFEQAEAARQAQRGMGQPQLGA